MTSYSIRLMALSKASFTLETGEERFKADEMRGKMGRNMDAVTLYGH